MRVSYHLLDPSGNVTILVETPMARERQPSVAAALLAAEPAAEQVGFLESPGDNCCIRVRMAGGEFCGNATLAAAALYGKKSGASAVSVGISGVKEPLTVTLRQLEADFDAVVDMPLPDTVTLREFRLNERTFTLPGISFPGITHLLLTEPLDKDTAERAVKRWCRELQTPGLGLMLLDEAEQTLTPLVYIPGADTLFWERSCASGTAAVGAAIAMQQHSNVTLSLKEPGGTLTVTAELCGDALARIQLGGRVRLLGERTGKFTV